MFVRALLTVKIISSSNELYLFTLSLWMFPFELEIISVAMV